MKKLLAIIVLGLLFSGNAYANNLIGKQLECKLAEVNSEYLIFINDQKVESLSISNETFEIFTMTNNYRASPKIIEFFVGGSYSVEWFTLNRSTLKTHIGTTCKVVKFNIKDHLEKRSKQLLEKQKKENKI